MMTRIRPRRGQMLHIWRPRVGRGAATGDGIMPRRSCPVTSAVGHQRCNKRRRSGRHFLRASVLIYLPPFFLRATLG